ncbi:DsbA family oxidoreductase [Corynebacterium aquilae]|uniref:DsbA family oxidoreductase n=1 Tax=Corynebacterium aquilae TaxID=203263 RepID=UPI0009523C41|nr:DsbA family oxidoreductase [Corynebacterium aquilae]
MRIDIYSDVVCPFCFIGLANLEQAINNLGDKLSDNLDIDIHHRAFELDPNAPHQPPSNLIAAIAKKYGISQEESERSQQAIAASLKTVGVNFDYHHARFGNTFDAHRLIHLAAENNQSTPVNKALMRAYLEQGKNLADHAVLRQVGIEAGLDATAIDELLNSDRYAEAVRNDETQAAQLGVRGVPFFVFDNVYAISGAQPVAVFEQALTQAAAQPANGSGACAADGSGCA